MPNKLFLEASVKSLEEGSFEVIASSGKPDRIGDTIDPKGWYLTNYKKNPVILWSHSSGGFGSIAIPPVAKADKVWVEDEKELKVKGHFADTPFAQELRKLVEGGFLNAVSVGFIPLVEDKSGDIEIEKQMYRRALDDEITKGLYGDGGTKFTKQELLEVSWVAVPALPSALVTARKMNLELITKELEGITIKPFPTEHACRLESPDKYKRFRRENCAMKHDGKCIDVIWGITKGEEEKVERQSLRYDKEVWTAASAKAHCSDNDGSFEAASEEEKLDNIELKEGRVISEKNRKLINNCITQMGDAIDALRELLTATEPKEDVAPIDVKGRRPGEMKGGGNPELRLMLLANKAVENALRKLKENKSNQRVEIRILRIASKAVDAAIIKAKAKL